MKLPVREALKEREAPTYVDNFYPIDCALGHNPYGFPETIKKVFEGDILNADFGKYYSFENLLGLTLGIVSFLEGTSTSAEQIFLSNGGIGALNTIFFKLLKPTGMLGVGPQFSHAIKNFLLTGGIYSSVPLNLWDEENIFPMNALSDEIINSNGKYSCLYLDNPNNPLGAHFSLDQLKELVELAQKHNLFVLVDEVYADFLPNSFSVLNLVNQYENLICVRSFSKAWGLASIRCGYLVVNPSLSLTCRKVCDPFTPSYLSAKIAAAALEDNMFFKTMIPALVKNKKRMCEIFQENKYTILPSHPKIPIFCIYRKGANVIEELRNLQIHVESGKCFSSTREDFGHEFARVRIVSKKEDLEQLSFRLETISRSF